MRLWVNGQQIVNNWTDHAPTENSGTIALTAGQRYDIRMEFYENGGSATAQVAVEQRVDTEGGRPERASLPDGALMPPASSGSTSSRRQRLFQRGISPTAAPFTVPRGNGQTYGWNADNSRS